MENEQLEKLVAEEEKSNAKTETKKEQKTYNGKFVSTQKISILKMLKNKTFMFWMIFILFILSFFCLTMMDSNNVWRPHALDGFAKLLAKWNLSIDVSMTVWFIFFILFGLVMCGFFCFSFYNYFHYRIEKKIRTEEQREPVDKDFVLFKVLFFTIPSLLFIGGVIAVVVVFNQRGWWSTMGHQLSNFGNVAANFGICLALIFGMILVPIILFFLVILLLKLIGLILGIFLVGPLSQSIVKSEEFRHEMEEDTNRARGIIQINNPTNLDMSKLDSKDAKFYVSGNNPKDDLQQEGGDIFPALTAIDKKWADKAEAERLAKEEEERKAAEAAANANNPENNIASETKTEETSKNDFEVTAVSDTRKKLDYESFKVLAYEFQSYLCHQKYQV